MTTPSDMQQKDRFSSNRSQRADKPSHSVAGLRSGTHECQIRFAKVAVFPRLQRFSITVQ
ncbi:hypothetical protein F9231_00920 [Bacillus safensis]|nr:hypothetical protein F9229_05065 [Bacillus safensis]KAB3546431.1 hypothetical protein F9231_00920 [Bacillus safensis]